MGRASRDKRDIYYRKAKEEGWRARSAFKLLQIDEEFNIFKGVKRVVDLCAAPGSWSQVLSRKLYLPVKLSPDSKDSDLPLIVAIDLQPMAPIEGVIQVQGDITNARTAEVTSFPMYDSISTASSSEINDYAFKIGTYVVQVVCGGYVLVPFDISGKDIKTNEIMEDWSWIGSLDILMDARLTWLSVMVLPMVKHTTLSCFVIAPLAILLSNTYTYPNTERAFFQVDLQLLDSMTWMNLFSRNSFWQFSLIVQFVLQGLTIVTHILKEGGKFIAKIFRGKDTSLLYCQLKLFFTDVTFAKPKSSRNSSIEAFAVCENYSPPEGFNERDLHRLLEKVGSPSGIDDLDCSSGWLEGPNKVYIPFLACGDLSGYDSDRSYPLPKSAEGTYQILDPVQPPIAPPYKRALEMKKASSQGIRDFDKLSLDP
ncbi:hypothetical protein RHSIM_Rhsim04G0234500 [Rhododendron simsii]|uniref:Ribosomal RNA methyltransferase FtsJ domain-containing protein n=1 Tax=Rhododendron simsii TaxID=118357 RepID=A0A834GZ30_RHOSS|nr:hypothetical protein RHSIM_Rhsim04G0234500 [Rhododendron simsii]